MPMDTELHKCVKNGDTAIALDIINDGADVNALGAQGRTALHRALGGGYFECAKMLLDNGADPNIADAMKRTSLHWAVLGTGGEECAGLLFEVGAGNAMLNTPSKSGSTPLHCAITSGRAELARLLLDQGADPELKDETGKSAVELAKANGMKDLFSGRGSVKAKGRGFFSRRGSTHKKEVTL
uniref:Uncharacterized protein n=1 Tax=Haptolina brevifila TaxID=156173 RepID=A0A7S2CJ86_9EUKA|mmetsp:Transcript_25271/g.50821  ORF Transcript_25271/g.50821 Transcript_25271/m.50821 type:complete len:183 (+) Transcript_25271:57-605(+)